jgi:hypothetical protein
MRHLGSRLALLAITAVAECALAEVSYTALPPQTSYQQALAVRMAKLEALLEKSDAYQRYILLDTAAKTAMELKQSLKAQVYAKELEARAASYNTDWNYASAIHNSRIILGRVALQDGDIEKAKRYLAAAGSVDGSDILDRSGPDLILANALLARGETKAVVSYLQSCKRFWHKGRNQLNEWLKQIGSGNTTTLLANPAQH